MADGLLVIGTRRYSSWSLRGWLAVRLAGLEVEERVIRLAGAGGSGPGSPGIAEATPAGLVPYLEHEGARVWESLAICEYCAEITPRHAAHWPQARRDLRAVFADREARSGTRFLYNDQFGMADAMYAPVVARFLSYLPELSAESRDYCKAVREHPLMTEWYDAAAREPLDWRLAHYEDVP
jgi:glutathione S-transferase